MRSRRAEPVANGVPIRPGCRRHSHGGPTITESSRRFWSLKIETSFPTFRSRNRRFGAGSIVAYRTSSHPNWSPAIAPCSSPRFTLTSGTALLAAVVGLLAAILRVSKGRLDYERYADGASKAVLLRAVERATKALPLSSALRVVRLSTSRY
jgi:hypothetical protein